MNIKKNIITGMAMMVMVASAATPQVKNVKAIQRYPWDSKVYVSYELVGDVASNVGNGIKPLLFVIAKDKTTGQEYGQVSAEDSFLSGDIGMVEGHHEIVWDIEAQGLAINSDNVSFTVAYCDYPYLIIDLSSGVDASSYPISYRCEVPAEGWTDEYKTTKLVLRLIGPGSFKMCGEYDVTLTMPFYCGIFEVTQKQYSLVTGTNPSEFSGDTLPVEQVSNDIIRGTYYGTRWPVSSGVDASSFMGKLRARTRLNFDLPTEAQWEYACRAGATTTFSYGDSEDGDYMWYQANSPFQTHEVGTKRPNSWGLYDMHGNVWEWCLDWYGSLSGGVDPKGPSSGSCRVGRGGGCSFGASWCTSSFRTNRYWLYPSDAYRLGFRIVRTMSD